jgi:psp operon transcriptional activator
VAFFAEKWYNKHIMAKITNRSAALPMLVAGGDEALGQSDAFLDFQESLARVAPVDRPVLLIGERGSGKELAARRLHFLSRRWQGTLVALNCAALPPSLLESELFGYERGAFTGAEVRRQGRFEAADGGSLFLDEIGALPLPAQEKILRVVEYGLFERLGSWQPVVTDVRLIGATNTDLPGLARQGRFLPDLLDRLAFEVLYLPPLRERKGDIPLLAAHFAARMAGELEWNEAPAFTATAMARLAAHSWPGNIRELKNVVERAIYRAGEKKKIEEIVIDPFQRRTEAPSQIPVPPEAEPELEPATEATQPGIFTERVAATEIALLKEALTACRYNQHQAAARLGLRYHQFRGVLRKYSAALGKL